MGKTKKAWKRLRSVDEAIPKVQKQKEFDEIQDSDLFTLDDAGVQISEDKLSRRQQRLKEHQERLEKLGDIKDVKKSIKPISQRGKIVLKPGRLRAKEPTPPPKPRKTRQVSKDIWEEPEPDPVAEADEFLKNGLSYDLKVRKIIRPKKPKKTEAYIPSVKRAIHVAKPGASYNPDLNDYVNYANEIAEEESERLSKEKKLKKAMSLPKGVNYVTEEEKQAEMEQGFFEESSSDEEDQKHDDNEPIPKKPSNKPKSLKKKKRALANKMAELERQAAKQMTKKERIQFANIKKIIKEMDKKDSEIKTKAKARAVEKMMDKLIKRKKLGRGEFEKYEEPVLLTNELKGSLRLAKTEGSLLQERYKSLQERNMLPVAGPDDAKRLPQRLKRKYVEKRDRAAVTATSRVI